MKLSEDNVVVLLSINNTGDLSEWPIIISPLNKEGMNRMFNTAESSVGFFSTDKYCFVDAERKYVINSSERGCAGMLYTIV